jgi:hypothetical protein
MRLMTSVISQTTITESTEPVNTKIKKTTPGNTSKKGSLEPSLKDMQRRRSLYVHWQSVSKKMGGKGKFQ